MKIIQFKTKYRDDMIYMILNAKNALGRVPRINDDLFDIKKNYLDVGDMFWLAVDENDRVIGSVGYKSIENSTDIWLHRLFVKPNLKRGGIGAQLLKTAEQYAKSKKKTAIYVHLGSSKEQWFESYNFYPKHGYSVYDDNKPEYMKKNLY